MEQGSCKDDEEIELKNYYHRNTDRKNQYENGGIHMKKTKAGVRRICSLLLCVMLVLAMLPAAAWADGTYTIDFSDGTVNESKNAVTYTVNNQSVIVTMPQGKTITNNQIEVSDSDTFSFEDFDANTMEVRVYASGGFNTTLAVADSKTSLSKRTTGGVWPDGVLKLEVCEQGNNPPEPGPEPTPPHTGYEGDKVTSNLTITGDVDFCINDSNLINSSNVPSSVEYTYNNSGKVDFYIDCFINERYTKIEINGTDYYSQLPTPDTPEGKTALLAACKGQLNEFKIAVPYSSDGYTVVTNKKGLDETDKDYMVVGNFLWTYTDQNQGDDYIDHGRMELVSMTYGNKTYSPEELKKPGTAYDWSQDENGGSAVLPVGSVVTVKLVPDYGYQLTSFGINGGNFGTGDEQSTFTFEIKPGNAHLGAHFTKVEDKVSSSTSAVKNGSIQLGANEITTGSAVLSVADSEASGDGFSEALNKNESTNNYVIASILDINLNQVLYKGTDDENNVWSNEMSTLQNPAEISLELGSAYNNAVIVHETHNGTYEIVNSTYNGETGTINFNTSSFSNYAIAVPQDKIFSVDFDPRGDEESLQGKVMVKRENDASAFSATSGRLYQYASDSTMTFTLISPKDREECVPVVDIECIATNEIKRHEFSESADEYSFNLNTKTYFKTENPSFIVHVWWSEFDAFGPNESEFMVHTDVPGGEEQGTISFLPAGIKNQAFDTEKKYVFSRGETDQIIRAVIVPNSGMKIKGFTIGNDTYGFGGEIEGAQPLPEIQSDGACIVPITIPSVIDTGSPSVIYIEAVFENSQKQETPPTVPSYTPPAETDPVKNDSASGTTIADVTPIVKDNTASAGIDTKTAESLVSATIKNQSKEIVIDATANTSAAADSTTTAEVGIPAVTLGVIAEKTEADVTVKTDVAEIKLDNAAAGAVAEQASGDTVQLIVERVDENKNKVEFQLKVVCSDGNVISDFKGGNVAITVAVPKDMADKKVVCVYIDDNGHMSKVKGQLNADGTFTFTTGHFSTYAILAEEEADAAIAAQKEAIWNIDVKLSSKQVKTKTGKKGIKITWTAAAGDKVLDGVEVFRSTRRSKGYGTKPFYISTKGGTEGYYINTKSLKTGTKYYYRVRGYILVDGQKVYTDYSNKAWRTVK